MDRYDIYSLEQIRTFDQQWNAKDALKGVGWLAEAMIGAATDVWTGFAASQTSTPSLTINLLEGWIYQRTAVDLTAWGGMASDGQIIAQQGYRAGGQQTFSTAGLAAGQSQWALVECTFGQSDAVRQGDPTNGILPYVNVQNPSVPFQGPNNSGVQQPTARLGVATLTIKYGAPSAGVPVAPAADAGYLPMYLVLLTFGQTTITNGQILVAGPAAYGGYPNAPYFPGVTGTIPNAPGGSHHGGIAGQASKIQLASEVAGILALANMQVSNANPAPAGGFITTGPELPIVYQINLNPNGNLAGNATDMAFDTVTGQLFICTVSGTALTAVWTAIGSGGLSVYVNAFPLTVAPGNFTYLCDTTAADQNVNLPDAGTMGGTGTALKNVGTGANVLTLTPFAGQRFEFNAVNATITLNKGELQILKPRAGYGWYFG